MKVVTFLALLLPSSLALRGVQLLDSKDEGYGSERKLKAGCDGFVRRRGYQLTLCDQPFYFVGFNAYWLSDKNIAESGDRIERFMRKAKDSGMNVGRIWGFSHGVPYGPGKYKEDEMKAFDHVIHVAGQVGIKLQIALGNFWNAYKGPEDWLNWAGSGGGGKTIKDFYWNSRARYLYMDHVKYMLYRTNTYNGKKYKDDPAIMSWDIMNEPRCPGCDAGTLEAHHKFLYTVGGLIRSIDHNHLITAGTEGYFFPEDWGKNTGLNQYNPGAGTQCEGEDWLKTNYMQEVDIAVTHVYERQVEYLPPSTDCSKNFQCLMNWARQYNWLHMYMAKEKLKKPLVIQETGVTLSLWGMTERKMWFKMFMDELVHSWKTGGPLMGVMFWNVALCEVPYPQKYDIYLDGCSREGRKLSGRDGDQESIHDINATQVAFPAPSVDTLYSPLPGPGRALLQDNLGTFRQESARMSCSSESFKTWRPKFDPWGVVNLDDYKKQVAGKSDIGILQDAAWYMNSGGKGR